MPDENGMPIDSDVCHCGVVTLDHTLRQLKVCHPAEHLNLPYEEAPGGAETLADAHGPLAGAVTLMAGAIDTRHVAGMPRAVPCIGFTFFGPDGMTVVARSLLVLDVERMRNVRLQVGQAIDGAVKKARRV